MIEPTKKVLIAHRADRGRPAARSGAASSHLMVTGIDFCKGLADDRATRHGADDRS